MRGKDIHPHDHSQGRAETQRHYSCHHHIDGTETNNICVSIVPIFNHLDQEQMVEISKLIQSIRYKKGETVYRAGDYSESLYIVREGRVRIYRLSEAGKEQLIRILRPGDFAGELALFNETIHEAYAEAMEETYLCTVKRTDLHSLLEKYPAISLKLLHEFSSRLGQSEKQTTRFATEKVETRIALFLAECIDDQSQPQEFVLPMSKKDLASYLGTTPETISRKLYELEALGYIKQKAHKKIEILDRDGLLLV